MADRPQTDENMAVSSDTGASQQTIRESTKEESEFRATQSNSKVEAPKKKTTFKITSVTKSSSQRGGSGDLTQDIDADSVDELDETVDSHTEDLSSEIYDLNSRATDVDIQDPLLSPEEVVKEKPGRFKVVKIETKEPFKRGRWLCYDYLDIPEKSEPKPEDSLSANSVMNSVHYTHGYDDPLKNPLLAGASGSSTILTRTSHRPTAAPMDGASIGPGEIIQPMAHAASQPGQSQHIIQAGQPVPNASYSNHVAQSMPVYSMDALPYSAQTGQQVPVPFSMQGMLPGQSIGHSMSASGGQAVRAGSSVPNLQQQARGQTQTSQSLSGTIPYSGIVQQQQPLQQQQQPVAQGTSIPVSVHSQPAPVPGAASVPQPQVPGAMHEYMNSVPQGMGQPPLSAQQQQQPQTSAQQPATGYNQVTGSAGGVVPQQNHLPPPSTSAEAPVTEAGLLDNPAASSALKTSHSSANLSGSVPVRLDVSEGSEDGVAGLGAGLEPLQIAVGGITNANLEEDTVTEDAGSSTVAIDNKIEQAMDLVKSHLMYAVREEVEVLKEQIKELMERLSQLEYENNILRAAATPDTLAKLTSTPQSAQPPSSTSSS